MRTKAGGHTAIGVLAGAVGAVGAAPGWVAASPRVKVVTPAPTISDLTSAPSLLYSTGGDIYLSAHVANARHARSHPTSR